MENQQVLLSGKSSFKIEVPYKLIETGEEGKKPLLLYLHGYGQTIQRFQQEVDDLLNFRAYHLFIQGPYPIYDKKGKRKVEDWGRAWYLYDGDQAQFTKSMEVSSEFIQEILDNILNHIEVNRVGVLGFSMGAYLAGYFALSRWKHVNDLIMIGGRLKTEIFEKREHNYNHLHALALHGSKDERVKAEPQQKSMARLEEWGAAVTFKNLEAEHKLNEKYLLETGIWLKKLGYKTD